MVRCTSESPVGHLGWVFERSPPFGPREGLLENPSLLPLGCIPWLFGEKRGAFLDPALSQRGRGLVAL